MKLLNKSLQTLTQHLQSTKALDPFSFDLISLADVSKDELAAIKKEVEGIELIHCDEFWELTEEIYKRLMFPTISEELQVYFIELQKEYKTPLKIQYQFIPWTKFKLTSSNQSKVFTVQTDYAEQQIQIFLNHLDIKDSKWIHDLYDFDYKFNFESEVESLFRDIALESWQKASQQTGKNPDATISEYNGGSHVYDLNSGEASH